MLQGSRVLVALAPALRLTELADLATTLVQAVLAGRGDVSMPAVLHAWPPWLSGPGLRTACSSGGTMFPRS